MSTQRGNPRATNVLSEGAFAPTLSAAIDYTIERFTEAWRPPQMPVGLQFPDALEAVYEAETRDSRVRELRFTVSAAAAFQFVTIITDSVFVPDMGWTGFWLRMAVAVCMMSAVVSFRRVSARWREISVCGAAFSFILAMSVLMQLSHAPWASYEIFTCTLGFIYANTTTPLRFRYACVFNLVCLAMISAFMLTNPRISLGLAGTLFFLALVGSSFSLIANYRMERALRLSYLLASKEALRLFTLARDRDKLEIVSKMDSLTGLANRGHFDHTLAAWFEKPAEAETSVCLLLLDVDFFKRYNDHYGHPAGDACLQRIAEALMQSRRNKEDLAFRYGGEEFGLLLLDITPNDAVQIAERIRQAVETTGIKHENRGDALAVVTISVGVAYTIQQPYPYKGHAPHDLIAQADQALYQAKRAGRNRVEAAADSRLVASSNPQVLTVCQ